MCVAEPVEVVASSPTWEERAYAREAAAIAASAPKSNVITPLELRDPVRTSPHNPSEWRGCVRAAEAERGEHREGREIVPSQLR